MPYFRYYRLPSLPNFRRCHSRFAPISPTSMRRASYIFKLCWVIKYLTSYLTRWTPPCVNPCPAYCRWGWWRLSDWRSCSFIRTTCWRSRSCLCRWDRTQSWCHLRPCSIRWWWSETFPGQPYPTMLRWWVPALLWPSNHFYQHTSLSALYEYYEIDSDRVEHVLREFIFLGYYWSTANRISRLDFPTPLFPISRTFIVRSLQLSNAYNSLSLGMSV